MMFHYQADHLRRITDNGLYIPCIADIDNCPDPDNCGYKKDDVPAKSVRYGPVTFGNLNMARQSMEDPEAIYDYIAELDKFKPSSKKMPLSPLPLPGPPDTWYETLTRGLLSVFN